MTCLVVDVKLYLARLVVGMESYLTCLVVGMEAYLTYLVYLAYATIVVQRCSSLLQPTRRDTPPLACWLLCAAYAAIDTAVVACVFSVLLSVVGAIMEHIATAVLAVEVE